MLTRRAFAQVSFTMGALVVLGGLSGCKGSAPIEASRIKNVRYTWGGGMTGGGEASELSRQKDGSVTLVTSSREWHNSREESTTYVLDETAFEQFAQIARDYDLLKASTRKTSDFIVYDAPSGTISYTVVDEDGSYDIDASFSIRSDQELSEREWEGWHAVVETLAQLASTHEGTTSLEPIRLTIVASGVQYQFSLNDSPAALDLARRCPLTVNLENYADNEKVFYLDGPLDTADTPLASGAAGTLCYYEPWADVVFFYQDGEPADGLYELGQVDASWTITYLGELEPGEVRVWSNLFEEGA